MNLVTIAAVLSTLIKAEKRNDKRTVAECHKTLAFFGQIAVEEDFAETVRRYNA